MFSTFNLTELRLETGDIILFRKKVPYWKWVLNMSPVVSIGIVLKDPVWYDANAKGIYIVMNAWSIPIFEHYTLTITPLHTYIYQTNYHTYVRLLRLEKSTKFRTKINQACELLWKDNSTKTCRQFLSIDSNMEVMEPKCWMSSFVASVYNYAGIFGYFHRISNMIPNNFSVYDNYPISLKQGSLSEEFYINTS